jgi:hypothetical protein
MIKKLKDAKVGPDLGHGLELAGCAIDSKMTFAEKLRCAGKSLKEKRSEDRYHNKQLTADDQRKALASGKTTIMYQANHGNPYHTDPNFSVNDNNHNYA